MSLNEDALFFCVAGNFFFEPLFTETLVQNSWNHLSSTGITPGLYSTSIFLNRDGQMQGFQKWPINNSADKEVVFLEFPSQEVIEAFCSEQELKPEIIRGDTADAILNKLRNAFRIIDKVPAVAADVKKLVKAIIVIHSPGEQIDVSYSHPAIPFSIFVSTCNHTDELANIRVAESIIHEAMHLKLTMIETIIPMVDTGLRTKIYSPWRLEQRPVQGVLHGLFVFRMLREFYTALREVYETQIQVIEFIEYRMIDIFNEIGEVKDLITEESLTDAGHSLVLSLLNLKLT